MEQKVKLNPFTYGKLDVATTVVQIATAVVGIILALNGNTAGLLALGSLAGGVRGNLLGDLLKLAGGDSGGFPKTRGPGSIVLVMLVSAVLLVGCGGISKQFLIDSEKAIVAEAGDYLTGCKQVTVAPAFSIAFDDKINYGGGVFAGCEENGRLMEFRCVGLLDEPTQKTRIQCEALSLWERKEDRK